MSAKWSEERICAKLHELARHWPDGYTLFSWSVTLVLAKNELMPRETRTLPNGHTSYVGSFDDAVIDQFDIPNDGGDPD